MPGGWVAARRRTLAALVVACSVVVACGSGDTTTHVANKAPTSLVTTGASVEPTTSVPFTTSTPLDTTTRLLGHVETGAPASGAPASDPAPAPDTAPTVPAPELPAQLADAAGGQAIIVTAPGYGATTATLTAYSRTSQGWEQAFGPWTAHVGASGVARPGAKQEGDGKTPSGSYGFDFAFGVNGNPGTHLAYRQVTGPSIVWDDDPASPLYNEWVDTDTADAGADPEPMLKTPAYDYGAVIAYNDDRAPGAGSAIFLHVSTGGPTAGCVSVPESQLLELLKWLDPGADPTIVIGVS